MEITTKTEVTLVLSGAEANELAVWLYETGVERLSGKFVHTLLLKLQELPEE